MRLFYALAIGSIVLLLPGVCSGNGYKAKLLEGSLACLKGVQRMNVIFTYDEMTIGIAGISNEDYVTRRVTELNAKESRKGTNWAAEWINARSQRYEPMFKTHFERHAGISLGDFPNERYTLIFKTTNVEPGFNAYVVKKEALLSGEAWIVETANPDHVICKIAVQDCPGMGRDAIYSSGERLGESYLVAGYAIGKLFKKKIG
jgi:hypothetical protein